MIDANSEQAKFLRVAAMTSSAIATFYLIWAWIRGATLRSYLWPQPKRFFREAWRWKTWKDAPDRLFGNSLPRLTFYDTFGWVYAERLGR